MGRKESVAKADWPTYSEEALVQDKVTIVAQVNGKVRGQFEVAVNAAEADLRVSFSPTRELSHSSTAKRSKSLSSYRIRL